MLIIDKFFQEAPMEPNNGKIYKQHSKKTKALLRALFCPAHPKFMSFHEHLAL